MLRFHSDLWLIDPLPLHLSSLERFSTQWWREVTKATLEARRG
jgi:hypothetical protein